MNGFGKLSVQENLDWHLSRPSAFHQRSAGCFVVVAGRSGEARMCREQESGCLVEMDGQVGGLAGKTRSEKSYMKGVVLF